MLLTGALQRAKVRTQIFRTHPVLDVYTRCVHCDAGYTLGQFHALRFVRIDLVERVEYRRCCGCDGVTGEAWS